MSAMFFATEILFREWLAANHETETELLVGYYKVSSGKPSMTWPQSVDQALCFGWIDGVRRSIDEESFSVRFTPRKATSAWSAINIEKVRVLSEKGSMHPAGTKAFENRRDKESAGYRYSEFSAELSDEFVARFDDYPSAREFFDAQPPGYRRISTYWVMSPKQEKTRAARFEKLLAASLEGKRI